MREVQRYLAEILYGHLSIISINFVKKESYNKSGFVLKSRDSTFKMHRLFYSKIFSIILEVII